MSLDRSTGDTFDSLVERLPEINYWWPESDSTYNPEWPGSVPATRAWTFYRSDFLRAVRHLEWESGPRLLAITGPKNVGKTTILTQLLRLFTDKDFRNLVQTMPERDDDAVDRLVRCPEDLRVAWALNKYYGNGHTSFIEQLADLDKSRVLYVPLQADPSFQLRPQKQLRSAIEYYEQEILEGDPAETRHYILLDDVHTLSAGRDEQAWGPIVADLLEESPARKVVVTGASETAVERELYDANRDEMRVSHNEYEIRPVLPLKFRDYLQRRYPIFEGKADNHESVTIDYQASLHGELENNEQNPDAYRISGSTFARTFEELARGEIESTELVGSLQAFDEKLAQINDRVGRGIDSPRAWIQQALYEYLLLGGYVSLALDNELYAAGDDTFRAYLRGESNAATDTSIRSASGNSVGDFPAVASDVLDRTLGSIHEQAPLYGPIRQERTHDLSRLYAWTAHTLDTEPFDYDHLLGSDTEVGEWILDVDRRTLREKYFDILERMALLTFSDGYGQQKPRHLRIALRDVGVANVLQWRDLGDVRNADSLRAALLHMVVFDHVMRFSYNVNHWYDPNRGVVRYWQDSDDYVEFVCKVWGTPVPIGFDAGAELPTAKVEAVGRFLDEQSSDTDAEVHDFVRYEPTVGTPDHGPSGDRSKVLRWFDDAEQIDGALDSAKDIEDLGDLWEASVDDLAAIDGIDHGTAQRLVDSVELYDLLHDVNGIGEAKIETLWAGEPDEDSEDEITADENKVGVTIWDEVSGSPSVESLAKLSPGTIACLPRFTSETAERVVEAARSQRARDEGEYHRRLDRTLHGTDDDWNGIPELGEEPSAKYQGRYQDYTWGERSDDSNRGGPTHYRIHDGESSFGIVLTNSGEIRRFDSPATGKPIFTIPVWMFLALT